MLVLMAPSAACFPSHRSLINVSRLINHSEVPVIVASHSPSGYILLSFFFSSLSVAKYSKDMREHVSVSERYLNAPGQVKKAIKRPVC